MCKEFMWKKLRSRFRYSDNIKTFPERVGCEDANLGFLDQKRNKLYGLMYTIMKYRTLKRQIGSLLRS